MNTTSTHFVPPRRVGIYEPLGMWEENFKGNGNLNTLSPIILPSNPKFDNLSEVTSHGTVGTPQKFEQEASTSRREDKIQRRLAQNREAARKSRLRKKAYVQQLETSRLKFIELEQELARARQQGFYVEGGLDAADCLSFSGNMNTDIATFEMEYGHWVEEQNKQMRELRTVLNGHIGDIELRIIVDNVMNHYFELFRMKSMAAKADVFYLMSGMWKTTAERFFLWIGGFRPSELLKVLLPHLDPMMEQQLVDVQNLRQSCQQAEDALTQGMEKLQQILAESVAAGQLGEGSYVPQMSCAMERMETLVCFLNQADHLRNETLQQMYRILTTRQAAKGLLALGEYFQRLRALSSSWASRQDEPS